jgi:hypothetical protein
MARFGTVQCHDTSTDAARRQRYGGRQFDTFGVNDQLHPPIQTHLTDLAPSSGDVVSAFGQEPGSQAPRDRVGFGRKQSGRRRFTHGLEIVGVSSKPTAK